jgi:hypothetical protein
VVKYRNPQIVYLQLPFKEFNAKTQAPKQIASLDPKPEIPIGILFSEL